jgi:hypothetical protein
MPRGEEALLPGEIHVISDRIDPALLARLTGAIFGIMVKYVVDVDRGVIAIGGELHADGEAVLLGLESDQRSLWGANYYPGSGLDDCIEYTALINIRPARGNPGMEVLDPSIRERIRELTFKLIGRGEPLP